jgi:hypothetical protein
MTRRCLTGWVASVLVLAGVFGPGVASSAKPTFERIEVDETFAPDEFLTEACGVVVTSHLEGHIIVRTFSGEGTGVAEVRTINVGITATTEDGTVFRFRDVGADVTRIEPDGTAVLSVAGQVPFFFAGVLKIDLETGEAIFEPRDRSEQQLARACAVLTGG